MKGRVNLSWPVILGVLVIQGMCIGAYKEQPLAIVFGPISLFFIGWWIEHKINKALEDMAKKENPGG